MTYFRLLNSNAHKKILKRNKRLLQLFFDSNKFEKSESFVLGLLNKKQIKRNKWSEFIISSLVWFKTETKNMKRLCKLSDYSGTHKTLEWENYMQAYLYFMFAGVRTD